MIGLVWILFYTSSKNEQQHQQKYKNEETEMCPLPEFTGPYQCVLLSASESGMDAILFPQNSVVLFAFYSPITSTHTVHGQHKTHFAQNIEK